MAARRAYRLDPTAHYSPFLSPHFLYLSHRLRRRHRRRIAHVRREATRVLIIYKSCGQARAPLCSPLMGRSSTCHFELRTAEPCAYAVQNWTNQYASQTNVSAYSDPKVCEERQKFLIITSEL